MACKAHQNYTYVIKYCCIYGKEPSKTKVTGTFPNVNKDIKSNTPYLNEAFEVIMPCKAHKAEVKMANLRKVLQDLQENIAKVDKYPPIKGQPVLDLFVTPKAKKNTIPMIKNNKNKEIVAVATLSPAHTTCMTSKKQSGAHPGWVLVLDGYSKEYFYQHKNR